MYLNTLSGDGGGVLTCILVCFVCGDVYQELGFIDMQGPGRDCGRKEEDATWDAV